MRPVTALILVLAIFACSGCTMRFWLGPKGSFAESKTPPPPDYSKVTSWASLPKSKDNADLVTVGFTDKQPSAAVDVFFVHPTTWMDRRNLNSPVPNAKAAELVDTMVLATETSVFNGSCNVYVPYYRQGSFASFLGDKPDALKVFTIAYSDVDRAFTYFLEHHSKGRPFIVASHSQGSMHAARLLSRIDKDAGLRARMVVAYVPGYSLPVADFGTVYTSLRVCENPEQTGCVAAWDTYLEGATVRGDEARWHWRGDDLQKVIDKPRVCVNPVSWTAGGAKAGRAAHKGAVDAVHAGEEPSFFQSMTADGIIGIEVSGLTKLMTQVVSAQCRDNALRVSDPDDHGWDPDTTSPGNFHLVDYAMFWADIRANISTRVTVFQNR
jgi:hypothetical protein